MSDLDPEGQLSAGYINFSRHVKAAEVKPSPLARPPGARPLSSNPRRLGAVCVIKSDLHIFNDLFD
jgi:hypothetical protein